MSSDINNNLSQEPGVMVAPFNIVPEEAELLNLINLYKRVSNFVAKDSLGKWINTFNYINSLDRDVNQVGGFNLSDYKIPNCLSGLLLPNSVTVTGTSVEKDYLDRPTFSAELACSLLSRNEFNDVSENIEASLFKDKGKTVAVVRKDVKLESVADKSCRNGYVAGSSDVFFPVPLTIDTYKTVAYNYSAKDMLHDAIVQAFKTRPE